jgi:uncharacterized protein YyaL (SSP411 family)
MNQLSQSTSPYLLQHAHNPVDWFPWGEEALARARAEDKPIFLSIGYAACHWCHVMAHESFEDADTAAYMNAHFVNIKVDREERPDLDAIYMQATTAMTGSGGWPMSVFLTPDLQPFYAGTYFPPVPRYQMPSFRDVLSGLVNAWQKERAEILKVGGQVTAHLQSALQSRASTFALAPQHLETVTQAILEHYDWGYGGWGAAPKFPQPMTIEFLLRRSRQDSPAPTGLRAALHTLQAMARGGMYDVVGGGFSRYSTDNFWRVPHFEKMLYDNAQLARAYLHAWQVTGEPFYRRIAEETLDFVMRELTHPEGGFYSSLDADSEGVEGKFYVWTREEIKEHLAEDGEFFEAAYGISAKGNWEGRTVLQRALDDASLATRFALDLEAVPAKLADCHRKLLAVRAERVRPATDDKVLTAWNGLMLAAFAEASRTLVIARSRAAATKQSPPNEEYSTSTRLLRAEEHRPRNDVYYQVATHNANFLLNALRPDGKLHRSWRNGQVTQEVFLEDYAALILGLLELYQTDFENRWFTAAVELADGMIARFRDPAGGFFDTPADGESLLVRPKDIQDNATPSGNALACEALLKLATLTDNGEYRDLAEQSLWLVSDYALKYPTGFACWLTAVDFARGTVKQVAVLGEGEAADALIQAVRSAYRPNTVIAASSYPPSAEAPTLLRDRPLVDGQPTAYVCEGFVCRQPVTDVNDLLKQL